MGIFNFMTGQAQPAYDPSGLQQYQPLWNTGNPQGMNYANVMTGGNAVPASQGIDWSVLGPWALSQQGNTHDYMSMLAALGGALPNSAPTGQGQDSLPSGYVRHPLGQVDQQAAGYIGPGFAPLIRPVGSALRSR